MMVFRSLREELISLAKEEFEKHSIENRDFEVCGSNLSNL